MSYPYYPEAIQTRTIRLVDGERKRQEDKWGEQNHDDLFWLAILSEEVGEVAQALLQQKEGNKTWCEIHEELVQVAAVALAWLEAFDRKGHYDD